jgi:predicted Zn finger-like uncharacterized protein
VKFLCDNCKAKYQIADEKVAGKTVRMKCRKCGHQIEVRAAVTETSTANAPPRPPAKPPARGGSGLATTFSATKPRAPSSPPHAPGALAGAFQRQVAEAPASVSGKASIELSVTDEWYVAINGVPVGPVRISELRRKAAAGAVTEDSLCWQEGLEEWRPIRSIPDLAALVREAAQGQRPSLVAPEPPRAPSMPPPPRAAPATARPSMTPAPPAPPRAPQPTGPGRSNVVPLRPAAAMAPIERASDDFGLGMGSAAPAFAPTPTPPQPQPLVTGPQPLVTGPQPIMPVPMPVGDPFAVPPPQPAADPYRSSVMPPPAAPTQEKKGGVPLWFWPVLVLALGFGGGLAFLVFRPQPTPPPVVIQMPNTATPPASERVDTPPPTSAEPLPTPAESGKKTVATRTTPKGPTEEKKGIDLGGLVPGAGGPAVGPGSSPGGAGGGLDQAGVERVVANHRAGVKRTCWERGGADQKSSVNVTVTANVAPNGSVAGTSSSGDDPVVAKCIENQVRTWTFPPPGSSTTINIPFKFVRQ